MLPAVLLPLLVALWLAAPAAAQSTAVVTPDLTNAGSHMRLTLDGTQPPVNGRLPKGLILAAKRGFRFDGQAVEGRCTIQQVQGDGCPANSRVGTGFADVTATSPLFGTFEIRAIIESFLAPRRNKKELAGVITTLNVMGTQTYARGYVDAPKKGRYGVRVVFDELPPTPGGFEVTLKRFEVEFGAERKVKGHRHAMLRNPLTCTTGSWPGRATLRFEDGSTGVVDAPIGCRARTQ
jgi:hypothetical protein